MCKVKRYSEQEPAKTREGKLRLTMISGTGGSYVNYKISMFNMFKDININLENKRNTKLFFKKTKQF